MLNVLYRGRSSFIRSPIAGKYVMLNVFYRGRSSFIGSPIAGEYVYVVQCRGM